MPTTDIWQLMPGLMLVKKKKTERKTAEEDAPTEPLPAPQMVVSEEKQDWHTEGLEFSS